MASSSNTKSYSLVYFPIQGRAEPIRLAFALAGIPFKNVALTFDQFQERKSTFPSGGLPVLEMVQDGEDASSKVIMDQSNSILRLVGKLGAANNNNPDLYPTDPIEAYKVDRILDLAEDGVKFISSTIMGPVRLFLEEDESANWSKEEVLAIRVRLMDEALVSKKNLAYYLNLLEAEVDQSASGFFVGENASIADLRVHQLMCWLTAGILDGIEAKDVTDRYPRLIALRDKVEALPAIKAFRAKYGTKYTDFDYTP